MRQFLSFVRKEFYHLLRDRRTILIAMGMPVMQIVLFGFALSTEVSGVRVGIVNPQGDVQVQQIVDRIGQSEYFEVVAPNLPAAEVESALRRDEVEVAIVFPASLSQEMMRPDGSQIQLVCDASDPNRASAVTSYLTSIIQSHFSTLRPSTQAVDAPRYIVPQIKLLYNPQMRSAYNFVPGVMGLIMIVVCAMMTAISIVREKERGTMEVLLVSPIPPIYIILAKLMPYFVLSCINIISILLLSVFVLDVPVAGSLWWLSVLSLLYIITSLSLGLLISTLADSQVAAMLFSGMGLMIPVVILSGMMFPIESIPTVLQWISNIVPARWYIAGVKKIMIEGLDVSYALKEILILLGMTVVLLTISLRKFKTRLE